MTELVLPEELFDPASLESAHMVPLTNTHPDGMLTAATAKQHQVGQVGQVAQDVVARFVADGPTAAELKAAKDNLVGGFALRIDSNRKLLDNVSTIAWHRLPLDYLDTWSRQLQAVTLADIRAAFARKLQPDRMVTVIVGGADTPGAAR